MRHVIVVIPVYISCRYSRSGWGRS